MFTFDLRGKRGILIFTLYNYRLGEGREYRAGYSMQKRLNSYAFYNIENNDLRIVHYDLIKARRYSDTIDAYTIEPGEIILGLKGFSCYYIDHNGQEIGYAGDNFFFYKYQIDDEINNCLKSQCDNMHIIEFGGDNSSEDTDFRIDKNKIIHDSGELYESKYNLKGVCGNVIIVYTISKRQMYNETRLYGICDKYGKLIGEIKYDDIYMTRSSITGGKYMRARIQNKYGLISDEGKVIIPIEYEHIDDWDWNIAVVNHGKRLIRICDQSVLFETDGTINGIVDGWMRVSIGDNPSNSDVLGFLDSSGNFYEFNRSKTEKYSCFGASFHDGLLPVFSEERGYGYIDINANEVIECKYCEISDFDNGSAKVRLDCEYGYINTKGCMLVKRGGEDVTIPKRYDWAYNYINGFYIVQQEGLWGAIDAYMDEIIPCSLKTKEEVEQTYAKIKLHSLSFSNTDYVEKYKSLLTPIRFEDKGLFGLKSASGELLFPPVLRVGNFVEGMAKINISGHWGYINEKLELVIPPKYEYVCDFSEGLALVHAIGEHKKFINTYGETVIPIDSHYENVKSFHCGVAECEYNPCTPGKDNSDSQITKYQLGYELW